MRNVKIASGNPYVINMVEPEIPQFNKEDYLERIELLLAKMEEQKITHTVVYADREHFSNMEYLTGFDPRFEEALFIMDASGKKTILLGNECMAYSLVIPYEINRVLYQNFSLQGQPRESLKPLRDILAETGIGGSSKIGIIGFKYFEPVHMSDCLHRLDIPSYIVDELSALTPRDSIINFTAAMTNLEDGIRMFIRNAKEIAHFEYAANKASNNVINILRGLKPGITEVDASKKANYDAFPISMFPLVNFGDYDVTIGLRSPGHRQLQEGDIINVCSGLRGSLIAKSGLAASSEDFVPAALSNAVEDFYKPFFRAIVAWYENVTEGADGGVVYDKVYEKMNFKKFGVTLNPGHNIGADEWTNSPFYKGSDRKVKSGYYLQSDIIASVKDPVRQAILEDGIVIADQKLRDELKQQYPEVYARIEKRRSLMKDVLGIRIADDVLPLSNCQGIMHPFMLDLGRFFVME